MEGPYPEWDGFPIELCRNHHLMWISTLLHLFRSAGDARKMPVTAHHAENHYATLIFQRTLDHQFRFSISIHCFQWDTRCLLQIIHSQGSSSPSQCPLLLMYSLLSALWSGSDDLFVGLTPLGHWRGGGGSDGSDELWVSVPLVGSSVISLRIPLPVLRGWWPDGASFMY